MNLMIGVCAVIVMDVNFRRGKCIEPTYFMTEVADNCQIYFILANLTHELQNVLRGALGNGDCSVVAK